MIEEYGYRRILDQSVASVNTPLRIGIFHGEVADLLKWKVLNITSPIESGNS
jgi:hypothetical protein